MKSSEEGKIDFILNKAKDKSWVFRLSVMWYELPKLYKIAAVSLITAVSLVSMISFNIIFGLAFFVFGSFSIVGLENLGQSITDSLCESIIYDEVEEQVEVVSIEQLSKDPVVIEQNSRLEKCDVKATLNSFDLFHTEQEKIIAEMRQETEQLIIKQQKRSEDRVVSTFGSSNSPLFWAGQPIEQEIIDDVTEELGFDI